MKKKREEIVIVEDNRIIALGEKAKSLDMKINIANSLTDIEKDLIPMTHNERIEAIEVLWDKVRVENPVAGDVEVYKNAIAKGEVNPAEDFSIKHEGTIGLTGEMAQDNIAVPGGISPEYHRRVQNRAEFNHWKKFWYFVNFYESNKHLVPDFDFHIIHVIKYAYNILEPPAALKYLGLIRYKLMQNIGNEELYSEAFIKYANTQLTEHINNLQQLVNIFKGESTNGTGNSPDRGNDIDTSEYIETQFILEKQKDEPEVNKET